MECLHPMVAASEDLSNQAFSGVVKSGHPKTVNAYQISHVVGTDEIHRSMKLKTFTPKHLLYVNTFTYFDIVA